MFYHARSHTLKTVKAQPNTTPTFKPLPHPHPNPLPEGEGILWGFLPFQGGGQEGDGVDFQVCNLLNPIPTLALPLKGRELKFPALP